MSQRKTNFIEGEFYHCYNRGVDKRDVFCDQDDLSYFLDAMILLNDIESSESIRNRKRSKTPLPNNKLVDVAAYCLNPNHFHLLLRPKSDFALSKFMQKLGTGYTMFFNKKYGRNGSLFQGKFKAVHIDSDQYLQHIGVYINLNNLVHKIPNANFRSSFKNFAASRKDDVCDPSILLKMCEREEDYEKFAYEKLSVIQEYREAVKSNQENFFME